MSRWTYRCILVGTVLLTVVALCGVSISLAPATAGAAGSVEVVHHMGGYVSAVHAADDYVVWARGASLEVYTAGAATRLGGLLLPDLIVDLDVDGTTAYLAARDGLYIVSLASLAQPTLLTHIPAPPLIDLEMVSAVVGLGSYVYVGLEDGGLWTVDLDAAASGAAAAQSVHAPDHHYVSELYHFGSYLFSVDNASGNPGAPQVWSLANPAAPALLGKLNTRSDASGLAVVGSRLYLSTFFEGLAIYNWNPAQPLTATLVSTLPIGAGAYDLAVTTDGTQAFLASDLGLVQVDASNPAAPVQRDVEAAPVGYSSRVVTRADRVFAAAGEAGLDTYSFTASSLTFLHQRGMPGSPLGGARLGSHVYVASNSQGLVKLAINNVTAPAVSGQLATGGSAHTVVAAGDYLVVGDGTEVVLVEPGSLAELGRLPLPDFNNAQALVSSGNTVFVAAGHAGLCAVDVTGGEPKLQSCFDTDGEALDVDLDGSRAYVADSGNGVVVLNVANPQNMLSLGRYPNAQAMAVAVAGSQLYVSDVNNGDGRLLLLNRGAGASLNIATQFNTAGFVNDIQVSGSLVYLANQEGLEVLQQLSPSSLSAWAWYPSAGGAVGVLLTGGYAYLMDGINGLVVLSVSLPPGQPTVTPDQPTATPGQPTVTPDPDVGASRLLLPVMVR